MKPQQTPSKTSFFAKGTIIFVLLVTIGVTAAVTYGLTKRSLDNEFNPDLYNAAAQMEILKTEIIKKNDSIQILNDSLQKLSSKN